MNKATTYQLPQAHYPQVWLPEPVVYSIDPQKLATPTSALWYVDGRFTNQPNVARINLWLTFENGQSSVTSAIGLHKVHKPKVIVFNAYYLITPVVQTEVTGTATTLLSLGSQLNTNDPGMNFQLYVRSDVYRGDGHSQLTQLAKTDRITGFGGINTRSTGGEFWLDGSENYDGPTAVTGPDVNGFGRSAAQMTLHDKPAFECKGASCMINDDFKVYVRYRHASPNSIWVTIGLVTWGWSAIAVAPGSTWSVQSSTVIPPKLYDSNEFPFWPYVHVNSLSQP